LKATASVEVAASRAPDFSPSKEMQLTIACCSWPPSAKRASRIRTIAASGVDWTGFMALVTRHRIPGLADAALRDAGIVPGDQAQVLAAAALHLRWQNRKAAAETIRVQALLQAQGILTVVFKGAALARLPMARSIPSTAATSTCSFRPTRCGPPQGC
jgi:hypothetical protein